MSATATAQPTNELPSHAPDPALSLRACHGCLGGCCWSIISVGCRNSCNSCHHPSFSSSCCFLWLMIRSTTLLPSSLGTLCSPLT